MSSRDSTSPFNSADTAPGDLTAGAGAPTLTPPDSAVRIAGPLTLRDGTRLYQRAIRPDDAPRLQAFHTRLSRNAVFYRFCGLLPDLPDELARRMSLVDYEDRMAIAITEGAGEDEPIIAVGRYERRTPGAAEFALAVEDRWQGRGIGPQLLSALADYARERGILTFIAEVLYDNGRMLSLLRHSSFPTTFQFHDGRVVGLLDISG